MTCYDVMEFWEEKLLPALGERYCLNGCDIRLVPPHEGGRNVVYTCEKEGERAKIIRISFLADRRWEDYLAELEYVQYLYGRGCSVSPVVPSQAGNLVEKFVCDGRVFFASVFEKAKGKMMVENQYQYRKGAPLSEYFYNCGKLLGRMHQCSKEYTPVHSRYSYFDRTDERRIDRAVPDEWPICKEKMKGLLRTLKGLKRERQDYGMIHFDYNDGNYAIDFTNGNITVYDFDDCCFGFYLYDLADLWTHGVGWAFFEPEPEKRRQFMQDYFESVLDGYRSETAIRKEALELLPLFINATVMENILEELEGAQEEERDDGELLYLVKCLEEDVPYKGFFSELYSCKTPFSLDWQKD